MARGDCLPRILSTILAVALFADAAAVLAVEHVVVRPADGPLKRIAGEVVVEAADGGLMLRSADGALHLVPAEELESRTADDQPFEMLDAEALGEHLLAQLPAGFQVHHSTNYVVCYNTTPTYARWCSTLLERLQKAFLADWRKRGCDVEPPAHPLPVLVFADQASYARYAKDELGPAARSVIGYYSLASNRVMMYDLTGVQALQRRRGVRGSKHDISALMSQPAAAPLIATIVHEATHQISYNCGLQTRLADNPLWVSEGLAVYFETPDVSSARGWRGIGEVNYRRWDRYQQAEYNGALPPLERLLADDKILRDPATAADGYAQAWAWNYFLIRWCPEQYAAYLTELAEKTPLVWDKPEQRLAEFTKHFGDLQELQEDFHRQMSRIR